MGDLSPMEGVELQIRSQPLVETSIPPSLDRRLAEGDQYRKAKEKLEATLQSIEQYYASPEAGIHSPPNCARCLSKKQEIIDAYHEYYLSPDPQAWYHNFPQLYDPTAKVFEEATDPRDSLEHIQLTYQSALRYHLRYLCLPHPTDNQHVTAVKNATAMAFASNSTLPDVLELYLSGISEVMSETDAATFLHKIQIADTPEDRAQVYINYYCSPSWGERPEQKNFKAKYARIFEQLVPHDEALVAMKREAEESFANKLSKKRRELGELQMAQSAHLKNKARKAEKNQRMQDREASPATPMVADCGFDGCPVELDLAEENVECAICEWLVAKDPASRKRRTYYCSVEHAEEDFEQHESRHHKCSMGDRCTNYPNAGPPGETEAGGICQQCTKEFAEEGREGQTPYFYFCSEDCYRQNLDYHRKDMHMVSDRPGAYEILERFSPAHDMDMVS